MIEAELDITTPYSGGTTITVGNATTANLLMLTTDSDPTTNGIYQVSQDTTFTPVDPVQVTVAGSPGAGAGQCIVRYVITPNA